MTPGARFLNPTGMHSLSSSPTTVGSDSQILEILSMPLIGRPIFIRSTEYLAGTFIQPDRLGVHETLWDGMTSRARFLNPTGMHSLSSSPTTVSSDSQILEILSMPLIGRPIFIRSTEYLAGTFIQPDHLRVRETLWDGMTPGARFLNPTGMHSVSSSPTTVSSDSQILEILSMPLIGRPIFIRSTEYRASRPGILRRTFFARDIGADRLGELEVN